MEFSTNKYYFKMLNEDELKKLKAGDKVTVCVSMNLPESAEFTDTVVVNPAFWNSDSDEPGWEIEAAIGYASIDSVYQVEKVNKQ